MYIENRNTRCQSETELLREAETVEFMEDKPEWGVKSGKQYPLKFDKIDLSEPEYYIVDDLGRPNVAALICLRSTLRK